MMKEAEEVSDEEPRGIKQQRAGTRVELCTKALVNSRNDCMFNLSNSFSVLRN